jgi:ubiquinone/menaquinone biosynthesis C-methylase UbiE
MNLSPNKRLALKEVARVLRPGGTLHLTDVVADDALTLEQRLERAPETGCTVGALSRLEYLSLLAEAGFHNITVDLRHQVADRMTASRIAARKPG